MFTKNSDVIAARRNYLLSQEKPAVGSVLRGLKGLPLRIHCQILRGSSSDIFAYATLVPLDKSLTADGLTWYLRDFASQELPGTKVVLNAKARDRLLKFFDKHPVFGECDVLPVQALRIVKIAASNRSVEAEIAEMVSDDVLDACAAFAEVAMDADTTAEMLNQAQADFYDVFNEARIAAKGAAA